MSFVLLLILFSTSFGIFKLPTKPHVSPIYFLPLLILLVKKFFFFLKFGGGFGEIFFSPKNLTTNLQLNQKKKKFHLLLLGKLGPYYSPCPLHYDKQQENKKFVWATLKYVCLIFFPPQNCRHINLYKLYNCVSKGPILAKVVSFSSKIFNLIVF